MSPQPISEKPQAPGCSRLIMGFIGTTFFLAGSVLMWFVFLGPMIEWSRAQNWSEAEATITKAFIETHEGDDSNSYSGEFEYSFEVNQKQYTGDKESFFEINGSRKSAKKAIAAKPVGTKFTCYYDPDAPETSVMNREASWSMLIGLFPLIFIVIGGCVLVGSILGWSPNQKKKLQSSNRSRDANLKSSIVSGKPLKASSELGSHPEDDEDAIWDKPQRLKPVIGRFWNVVLCFIFAAFWNGIVSVFLVGLLTEGFGGFGIFMLLFLIPFLLVGVFLIGVFFHTLLSYFNPKIEIALSTGAVPLGGDVDVAWQIQSRARWISQLNIKVIAKQQATYQRGTDRITDEEVFETIQVTQATSPEEIEFGSVLIRIPEDSMHTFESDNNEIEWSIVVHAVVPRWPDTRESFPFRVTPAVIKSPKKP